MENETRIELDEDFLFYSLIYSAITVVFAIGVLQKFLTSELRFGIRSLITLGVLFIGEPVCHFLLKGSTGTIAFGIVCLFIYSILPSSHLSAKGKVVLITGCDSGFGHALAQRLDEVGMIVYAGCLHSDGPGAIQLGNKCSSRLTVIKLDVTKYEDMNAAYEHITSQQHEQGLWGLVNCASLFFLADLELTPHNVYQRSLEVNYMGVVRTTKTFLPLIRQSRGRIVNLGSLTGQVPVPHCGAYTASMHALHGFSHVLSMEMRRFGVKVSVVEPGGFKKTPTWVSSLTAKKLDLWSHITDNCRETYGQSYLDDMYKSYENMMATLSTDLTPVVRALKSGLLSKRPRVFYPCEKGVEVLTNLYPLLPGWFGDRLVEMVCPVAGDAVPQCLKG